VRRQTAAPAFRYTVVSLSLQAKHDRLQSELRERERLLVAYSGGVDSAYLAWAAHQALGTQMRAVIADSPSLARWQLQDALAFAAEQGIACAVINTAELENPDYVRNQPNRCYHCKDELFSVMTAYASENSFSKIAYGVNFDDLGDFRPGQHAAAKHEVLAPLANAGLTKNDIRTLAREAGLRIWDKPAAPCLASRVEYGRPVTREALSAIEQGEDALRRLGFREFRVRHHGDIVRVEVARQELERALDPAMAEVFVRTFKALGFTYVTLDLEGFRSGSMNAVLPLAVLKRG
jgi:pyridinium-3,5-biscarboxylic acid mononucleotide sulfurtransferase